MSFSAHRRALIWSFRLLACLFAGVDIWFAARLVLVFASGGRRGLSDWIAHLAFVPAMASDHGFERNHGSTAEAGILLVVIWLLLIAIAWIFYRFQRWLGLGKG